MRLVQECTAWAAASLAILTGCTDATPTPADDAAVLRIAQPDAYLKSFVLAYALGSDSVLFAIRALRREKGCRVLSRAVEVASAKRAPGWRRDLLAAYRETVPPRQLAIAAQRKPDDADEFLRPYSDKVWSSMGRRNGGAAQLASREVSQAMTAHVQADRTPPPPSKRELIELRYSAIGSNICPELKPVFFVRAA